MDAQRSAFKEPAPTPVESDGFSLPGWIYRDADFLEAEKELVFAPSWQVVCHLNDIPQPGDYHTLEFLGEPLVAVRQQNSSVKAFFNVCRKLKHEGTGGARRSPMRDRKAGWP